MRKTDIGEALRTLPRTDASAGFENRVLRRLEDEPRRWVFLDWRFATAAATAVLLVASITFVMRSQSVERDRIARERVETLRNEYRSLEQELLDLQRMAVRTRPIVGVDGSGEYDFLIDLRNLYARRPNANTVPSATPVSYRPGR